MRFEIRGHYFLVGSRRSVHRGVAGAAWLHGRWEDVPRGFEERGARGEGVDRGGERTRAGDSPAQGKAEVRVSDGRLVEDMTSEIRRLVVVAGGVTQR